MLAACAAGLASGPARAAALDDYLAAGYAVMAQTSIVGAFSGCQPNLTLTFADGTRFTCIQKSSNSAADPRVYILARLGEPVSAVLIGSRAYPGAILQLGARTLPRPAPIGAEPPTARIAPVDPNSRIAKLNTVQSINALQADASRRLNDAQNDPLPPHAPTPHK